MEAMAFASSVRKLSAGLYLYKRVSIRNAVVEISATYINTKRKKQDKIVYKKNWLQNPITVQRNHWN